ncbi:MAG: hypothetical protein FH761_07425 [Firmicutes bacterium]|nr:hypothetical protein [Bacillota bacterium]
MKKIFSYNIDVDKNAYMNWRTNKFSQIDNMITIADGFMKASISLAERALDQTFTKEADILIFPILFNANHAIELYLKAITWTLNVLLDKKYKIEGNHDIKQIFSVVQSRVREFESSKERKRQFKELTQNLVEYLSELFEKINSDSYSNYKDNMDFSRYPFDQQYINHFYINEFDNVVVDLENFINRFKEIGENLNMISKHYLYDFLESDG